MRSLCLTAALVAAAMTLGCVPTTQIVSQKVAFDRAAHADIKTVALLEISEPKRLRVCDRTLVGLRTCETLEANEADAAYGAQLTSMIAAKLQRDGYRVERLARPVTKQFASSEVDYSSLQTRANAILDVKLNKDYFGFVLGKEDTYRPSVLVFAKLMLRAATSAPTTVRAPAVKPIYTLQFDCQRIAGGDQSIMCPANTAWDFPPIDHVTVRDSTEARVQQTFTGVFEFLSDRIAADLSR